MKQKIFILLFILLTPAWCFSQQITPNDYTNVTTNVEHRKDGRASNENTRLGSVPGAARRGDGYIVYKNDTVKGHVFLSRYEVVLEKRIDNQHNFVARYQLDNLDLKTVMMYNVDKKPLCVTRVRKNDKQMMRVIHEGKLNIYDDRIDYIYEPGDIDKNLIYIAYDNVVDDLSSFLTEHTKRDLIGYVNDIYGLKLEPRTITWKELLMKIDMLD